MPPKTSKKALGLTTPMLTATSAVETASRATALTPGVETAKRKRKYKARARKCAHCKEPFTPKRNGSAKFCSDGCRVAYWKKQHRKPTPPAEPVLTPLVCEHCGQTFWGNAESGQRYHSASCRTLAWKARREAAALALSQSLGMSLEKARDVVEAAGMRELKRMLGGLGMVYDASSRQWVVPVDESVFVQQDSA